MIPFLPSAQPAWPPNQLHREISMVPHALPGRSDAFYGSPPTPAAHFESPDLEMLNAATALLCHPNPAHQTRLKRSRAEFHATDREGPQAEVPRFRPPVWAATRQELCEGTGYFKSYQGGTYPRQLPDGRRVPVWLIDSTTSLNGTDIFTGRLIISHTGGNFDSNAGAMKSSQTETDPARRLFLEAQRQGTPVLVICGTRYNCILDWSRLDRGDSVGFDPYDAAKGMPARYVVLGWGKITDSWVEPEVALPANQIPSRTGRKTRVPRKKQVAGWIPDSALFSAFSHGFVKPDDVAWLPKTHPSFAPFPESTSPTVPRKALRYKFRVDFIQTGSAEKDCELAGRWWPHLIMRRQGPVAQDDFLERDEPATDTQIKSHAYSEELIFDPVRNQTFVVRRPINSHSAASCYPSPPVSPISASPFPAAMGPSAAETSLEYVLSDGTEPCNLPRSLPDSWDPCWAQYLEGNTRPLDFCQFCSTWTPQRWAEGWMCGNEACSAFWKLCSPDPPFTLQEPPAQLHYNPCFLLPVLPADPSFHPPFSIVPDPPPNYSLPSDFEKTGFHCQLCGRISIARNWANWECLNCGFRIAWYRPAEYVPSSFHGPGKLDDLGYLGQIDRSHILRVDARHVDYAGRLETRYLFPDGCYVIHRRSPNGHDVLSAANAMFADLQVQAALGSRLGGIDFARRLLKRSPLGKGTVTSHYSVNFGEAYGHSLFLPAAPWHPVAFNATRFLASEAGVEFNEMLIALYAKGCRMDWHDDGENGVQPTIAAWSLGSPCIMSFRAKQNPRVGPISATSPKANVLRLLLK